MSGSHAMMLAGSSALSVSITNQDIYRSTGAAGYYLNSDGTVRENSSSGAVIESWLTGGTSSQAECFAEVVSGTIGGTTNAWLPCSTTRGWTSVDGTIKVRLRQVGTSTVLDEATITLLFDTAGGGG